MGTTRNETRKRLRAALLSTTAIIAAGMIQLAPTPAQAVVACDSGNVATASIGVSDTCIVTTNKSGANPLVTVTGNYATFRNYATVSDTGTNSPAIDFLSPHDYAFIVNYGTITLDDTNQFLDAEGDFNTLSNTGTITLTRSVAAANTVTGIVSDGDHFLFYQDSSATTTISGKTTGDSNPGVVRGVRVFGDYNRIDNHGDLNTYSTTTGKSSNSTAYGIYMDGYDNTFTNSGTSTITIATASGKSSDATAVGIEFYGASSAFVNTGDFFTLAYTTDKDGGDATATGVSSTGSYGLFYNSGTSVTYASAAGDDAFATGASLSGAFNSFLNFGYFYAVAVATKDGDDASAEGFMGTGSSGLFYNAGYFTTYAGAAGKDGAATAIGAYTYGAYNLFDNTGYFGTYAIVTDKDGDEAQAAGVVTVGYFGSVYNSGLVLTDAATAGKGGSAYADAFGVYIVGGGNTFTNYGGAIITFAGTTDKDGGDATATGLTVIGTGNYAFNSGYMHTYAATDAGSKSGSAYATGAVFTGDLNTLNNTGYMITEAFGSEAYGAVFAGEYNNAFNNGYMFTYAYGSDEAATAIGVAMFGGTGYGYGHNTLINNGYYYAGYYGGITTIAIGDGKDAGATAFGALSVGDYAQVHNNGDMFTLAYTDGADPGYDAAALGVLNVGNYGLFTNGSYANSYTYAIAYGGKNDARAFGTYSFGDYNTINNGGYSLTLADVIGGGDGDAFAAGLFSIGSYNSFENGGTLYSVAIASGSGDATAFGVYMYGYSNAVTNTGFIGAYAYGSYAAGVSFVGGGNYFNNAFGAVYAFATDSGTPGDYTYAYGLKSVGSFNAFYNNSGYIGAYAFTTGVGSDAFSRGVQITGLYNSFSGGYYGVIVSTAVATAPAGDAYAAGLVLLGSKNSAPYYAGIVTGSTYTYAYAGYIGETAFAAGIFNVGIFNDFAATGYTSTIASSYGVAVAIGFYNPAGVYVNFASTGYYSYMYTAAFGFFDAYATGVSSPGAFNSATVDYGVTIASAFVDDATAAGAAMIGVFNTFSSAGYLYTGAFAYDDAAAVGAALAGAYNGVYLHDSKVFASAGDNAFATGVGIPGAYNTLSATGTLGTYAFAYNDATATGVYMAGAFNVAFTYNVYTGALGYDDASATGVSQAGSYGNYFSSTGTVGTTATAYGDDATAFGIYSTGSAMTFVTNNFNTVAFGADDASATGLFTIGGSYYVPVSFTSTSYMLTRSVAYGDDAFATGIFNVGSYNTFSVHDFYTYANAYDDAYATGVLSYGSGTSFTSASTMVTGAYTSYSDAFATGVFTVGSFVDINVDNFSTYAFAYDLASATGIFSVGSFNDFVNNGTSVTYANGYLGPAYATGLFSAGYYNTLVNFGTMFTGAYSYAGTSYATGAVFLGDGNAFINYGSFTVSGDYSTGVYVGSNYFFLYNAAGATIGVYGPNAVGVYVANSGGEYSTIINVGSLISDGPAIITLGGYDFVANYGTLVGGTYQGSGDDTFLWGGPNDVTGYVDGEGDFDTFQFDGTVDFVYDDDQILNYEELIVTGDGRLIIALGDDIGTGNSLYELATIDGGHLHVEGELTVDGGAGTLLIIDGGILSGHGGTIDADVDNDSGFVLPGSSIGDLFITGDFTQGEDGTIVFEVGGALGNNDFVGVTGDGFLDGTAVVEIDFGDAPVIPGDRVLMDFGGTITGDFATVTGLEFLAGTFWQDTELFVTEDQVILDINLLSFCEGAITPSQTNLCVVLDDVFPDSSDELAFIITDLSLTQIDDSPPFMDFLMNHHASNIATSVFQDQTRQWNELVRYHNHVLEGQWSSFVFGSHTWGDVDSDGGAPGLRTKGSSVLAGTTYGASDRDRIGFFAGASFLNQEVFGGVPGENEYNSINLGLHGSHAGEDIVFSGVLGVGLGSFDSDRMIVTNGPFVPGPLFAAAEEVDALSIGGHFEMKFPTAFNTQGSNFHVMPVVGIDLVHFKLDGFTEEGTAGNANLIVAEVKHTSAQLFAGFEFGLNNGASGAFHPFLSAYYVAEVGDRNRDVTAAFVGFPADPFTYFGVMVSTHGARVNGGFTYDIKDDLWFSVAYHGFFSGIQTVHGVEAALKWIW